MMTMHGGQIAFYRGDVKKILEDVKMTRPTGFPSVPRLLNRVYDKVGLLIVFWVRFAILVWGLNQIRAFEEFH